MKQKMRKDEIPIASEALSCFVAAQLASPSQRSAATHLDLEPRPDQATSGVRREPCEQSGSASIRANVAIYSPPPGLPSSSRLCITSLAPRSHNVIFPKFEDCCQTQKATQQSRSLPVSSRSFPHRPTISFLHFAARSKSGMRHFRSLDDGDFSRTAAD